MSSSSTFPSHLTYLSTLLLVTRSTQFTHTRQLPILTLSHLFSQLIESIATKSKLSAELSGRSKSTVWDVVDALEELGIGTSEELLEEVEKGDQGIQDQVMGLRELSKGLQGKRFYLSEEEKCIT